MSHRCATLRRLLVRDGLQSTSSVKLGYIGMRFPLQRFFRRSALLMDCSLTSFPVPHPPTSAACHCIGVQQNSLIRSFHLDGTVYLCSLTLPVWRFSVRPSDFSVAISTPGNPEFRLKRKGERDASV